MQEADLIREICGAHGGYETTAEVADVRRIVGGRGLWGGSGKKVDGVFIGRPQRFQYQSRPVDDCSPGREGIAQGGRTRGRTFHDEMDRCSKSQGWTTACSRKRVDGVFPGQPQIFGINADQWTTTAQERGEWLRTAEQGAEHFMAEWIAAAKARAGLRHAVVCPNVTGKTKARIAQSKRARAGSLAIVG